VLITGAARGLGLAVARRLAARGAGLILHHFDTPADEMRARAEELVRSGAPEVGIQNADLTDAQAIGEMFRSIKDCPGRLDCLVNNAGIFLRKPLLETEWEEWSSLFSVNVAAPALCIRYAVQLGCTQVVNIADIAWDKSWKNHGAYIASKSALAALTRVAAVELAPDVRVNAVAPGLVSVPDGMKEVYGNVVGRIPAGRTGTEEEIAQTVEMLLDAPDYLTGQVIAVDGGLSLR